MQNLYALYLYDMPTANTNEIKDIKIISLYPVRTEWTHADLPVVFFKISLDGSGGI